MSLVENPASTILRLIDNRIVVVKENAARAAIKCSEENYDRELLKDYDAQITCSLVQSEDQKLNMAATLRRRVAVLKVVGVSTNKELSSADSGKKMRDKVTAQINTIIRELRQIPYETTYNFYGLGYPTGTPHKAFDGLASAELEPSDDTWGELDETEYQDVWASDDVFHEVATSTSGQYPQALFRFKIGKKENTDLQPISTAIKSIVLTFVGYGLAAAGNGVTFKVWNKTSETWGNAQTGTGSSKETLTITLSSSWTDYVDSDGYCWVLVRTTNPSAGAATTLYCDFVQCVIQVNGLTYIDVVSYQNRDVTEVKPYLFITEFSLRGWLFETIST